MEKEDLKQNRVYRAKKPARVGLYGFFNDRQIIRLGETWIQYDSPAVRDGRHYPKITIEKFLKWVGEDITDLMPKGDWSDKKIEEMRDKK